ncbi:cytochrome c oxidase copper chaperone [[Candida] railenensis]|uniref:Cytochrome c oxidase copper chaperone n=1 Tax=[Candida] railenensis TaxID=45579 RepID=A0A9P0QVA3_9ASCO|nr:cytochrome c oxidase copper chaperone [[Candida] railenensis]
MALFHQVCLFRCIKPKTKPKMSEVEKKECPVKPKPCCVCLDEKKLRDECLLFNGQEGGKCNELIGKYKECMKGFGFETR